MAKRFFSYITLIAAIALSSGIVRAQTTYPVQVNAHLLPPYSLYLSDYYSGTREKLTVTLINRDQQKPVLNVRLRMTITAPGGIRLQTRDNVYYPPIQVDNSAPVRLTLNDLAPYFQPGNLITQGFLQDGKLPEGMVEFCFQAVEAYTGQPLSISSCTRAWVTSQKPPLLSLPQANESVVFRDPLNLLFQWTPRQQGLANVEYEFILKELWDNGMAPQAAFPYAPEIYRETVRSTTFFYGAQFPPLMAGKRYAWVVRAQARDGIDPVNLFQNNGYSEVRVFSLQNDCPPPELVTGTAERKRLNVEWGAKPIHLRYNVSYRSVNGSTYSEWKSIETVESRATIYGLQGGGTYEYRVGGYCGGEQAAYSQILKVTLPNVDSARLAQCGIMPALNLTNQEPIRELKTGEVIMANDFPVTVTKISGTNGVYTGEGWTIIPWLNDAKIAVEFSSITINTDKQMIEGYIDAKYDKNEGQIANLDEVWEGGFDVGTVQLGITHIDHKFDFSIPGVEAFGLSEEGELVITEADGTTHTINEQYLEGTGNEGNKVVVFPMTVQDKDGNVYQVEKVMEKDENGVDKEVVKAKYIGKITAPLAAGSFDPTQLNGDKAIVTFSKEDGEYAFDEWKEYYGRVSLIKDKYEKLYEEQEAPYKEYYAPWKLVPAGKADVVYATIEIKDNSIDHAKVFFKSPTGTEYQILGYDEAAHQYKIQLAAGPAGDVQEIYALHPREEDKYWTLGKLSVASYTEQAHKVVLVSVNGAPEHRAEVEQRIKEIYGPIGVEWQVERDVFEYAESIRLMENSTGISTYNEAMSALNDAYKEKIGSAFDGKVNYVFFLKATGNEDINNRDFVAFMPRGAQFGYVFTSEVKDVHEPVTVAHELGHGRFKLFHTFDNHYGAVDGSKSTDNLMDYNNGGYLAKWQWDVMHDPALLVNAFEGDGGSAVKKIKGNYTVFVGDSIMNEGKIFVNSDKKNKISIKYESTTEDTAAFVYSRIVYLPELNSKEVIPSETWSKVKNNLTVTFNLDSVPNGSYKVSVKNKSGDVEVLKFYLRSKISEFSCKVCGRDLTVTLDKITTMSQRTSVNFSEDDAKLLNDLLKLAGFNSCKSHAHFFSQSGHETQGFNKFAESTSFSIDGFFEGGTFKGNCNTKLIYNQKFWSDKTYKGYFSVGPLYETSSDTTAANKFISGGENKYLWGAEKLTKSDFTSCLSVVTDKSDTIKYPEFAKLSRATKVPAKSIFYLKYTLSQDQKLACDKKLYSLLYATFLGNGSATTTDGYDYRGRGFVHLTGRNNYRSVSDKCNSFFKTDFDFENDFDKVTTDRKYVIYSAVAYYLNKNAVSSLHTKNCKEVTKIVNGGTNGYDDPVHSLYTRLSLFKKYKKDIFYGCNITESE